MRPRTAITTLIIVSLVVAAIISFLYFSNLHNSFQRNYDSEEVEKKETKSNLPPEVRDQNIEDALERMRNVKRLTPEQRQDSIDKILESKNNETNNIK